MSREALLEKRDESVALAAEAGPRPSGLETRRGRKRARAEVASKESLSAPLKRRCGWTGWKRGVWDDGQKATGEETGSH